MPFGHHSSGILLLFCDIYDNDYENSERARTTLTARTSASSLTTANSGGRRRKEMD